MAKVLIPYALVFSASLHACSADFTQASYGIMNNGRGVFFMSPDGSSAVGPFYNVLNVTSPVTSLTNTVFASSPSGLTAIASISSTISGPVEIATAVSNGAEFVVTLTSSDSVAPIVNVRDKASSYGIKQQFGVPSTPRMAKISGDALTLAILCDLCGPTTDGGLAVYRRSDVNTLFSNTPTTAISSEGWSTYYGSGQALTAQGGFIHRLNDTVIEVQTLQGGGYARAALLNMTNCPATAGGACDCYFTDVSISSDGTIVLAVALVSYCPPPDLEGTGMYVVQWQQLQPGSAEYSLITTIPAPATYRAVQAPAFVQGNRAVLTWTDPATRDTAIGVYGVSNQDIGLVLQQSMPGAPCSSPGDSNQQTLVASGQDGDQILTSSWCLNGPVDQPNTTYYTTALLYTAVATGNSDNTVLGLSPMLQGVVIGSATGGGALLCSILIACGCFARCCARRGGSKNVGEVVLPKAATGSPTKSAVTAVAARVEDVGPRNTTPMLSDNA